MKTSIALIGFMGTGKTAVGKLLSQKLGKEFIELDYLIEKKTGRSIQEIFRRDGEVRFRELEIEAVAEVSPRKNIVIACGGGVVLNTINVERLRKESVIICLTASASVILKRTAHDGSRRPLLNVADRAQEIKKLLDFRRPFYARAADITVNTSRLDADGVVARILGILKDYESNHRQK
ncbi:MAG: shikimate kinase [Dehalococcoidales bacterium]|nr:shikimate kinase [Dehalococcoidales bacterium]